MLRLLALGLLFGLFLPHATAQKPSHAPLETRLQAEPGIVHGSDGHSYLALELHLTNVDSQRSPITLERLRILDADTNGEIATLTGNATWKSMRVVSTLASPDADPSIVGPSEHVLLYLFLPLPASAPAPKHVEENLTIRVAGMDHSLDFICCKAAVREPTVVDAPLKGAGWAAINGPSNQSIHRRALLTVDGRLLLGQRFAIDWMQTDSSGKFFHGKGDKNEDFFCFGHPLLAVADGTVEATHDGIPENPPGGRAVEIDYNTLAGNFVVLKSSEGMCSVSSATPATPTLPTCTSSSWMSPRSPSPTVFPTHSPPSTQPAPSSSATPSQTTTWFQLRPQITRRRFRSKT